MFKKILVPTDGSPLSDKAVNTAVEYARTAGSELVVLSVAEPFVYPAMFEGTSLNMPNPGVYDEKAMELARQYTDKVASRARESNVTCEPRAILSFHPYEAIVRAAEECHCDAIFMASHGRKGMNRLFIGSETQKVLAHTSLPVLVVR